MTDNILNHVAEDALSHLQHGSGDDHSGQARDQDRQFYYRSGEPGVYLDDPIEFEFALEVDQQQIGPQATRR